MKSSAFLVFAGVLGLVAGCAKEAPRRTVADFMEDPILLEATMVRCSLNRPKTKYEADCVVAREAANRLAAREDEARRKTREAESERKRLEYRRTQEAAAEARRRAAEAQRLREEAEYLAQFAVLPEDGTGAAPAPSQDDADTTRNDPAATVQPADSPAAAGETESPAEPQAAPEIAADLGAVREEMERRRRDEAR